jgi:hypothetical protein
MTPALDTLFPAEEIDPEIIPPDFRAARDALRTGIVQAAATGAPDAVILAALMAETLPRLINAYGPGRAATILARLAHDIGSGIAPNCRPQ